MSHSLQIVLKVFLSVVFAGLVGWVGIRALKRSEDPPKLIFKWLLSAGVFAVLGFVVVPVVARGGYSAAFVGVPFTAVCGLVLAVIWRRSIAGLIANPFGSLYDGGSAEIEPQAVYSVARTKRNRGQYDEAISELRKQLEQFPTDFEAQYMLAAIQAENQFDLQSADVTIQRLVQQPGHPPKSIAYALNSLADWQLRFCQDRDAARAALEKIIFLLPDSEVSAMASQRIAHLADTEHLLNQRAPKRIALRPGVENMGLLSPEQQPKAPQVNPATQVAEYVEHLAEHPLDTEARENLAVLYADHYGRTDLAADQLEQLIAHPGQPAKRVVHWLNLLADLQVRHGTDYAVIRQTVQRIMDLYPNSPFAEKARNRLDHLKLEVKGQEKGQTVKLGSYEKDIGLKSRLLD